MITDERVQEIKDKLLSLGTDGERLVNDRWIEMYAEELITALEAAQAELAEADDAWWITCQKETGALRAQLAEAQAEVERLDSYSTKVNKSLQSLAEEHTKVKAELDEAKSVLIGQREDRRFDRKRLVKIDKERNDLRNELDEVKSKAWKTVDLEEGNLLTFVGVHVVAWQQEWGQPKVGFTRWNDDNN